MATQSFFCPPAWECEFIGSANAPLIEWAGQLNFKFEAIRLESPS